jgi:hypothetical protein
MAVPLALISAGLGVANKLFGKKKKYDNRRAIAELRASRPTGYITPEDLRAAELTRGRLSEAATAEGGLAGAEIARRYQARGLAGSPSEERSRARLEDQVLLGKQHAGESAEEQLYNTRTSREAYQHANDLAIFGAQTGETERNQQYQMAQNGAFWNSLNEFMPAILTGTSGGDESGLATTPTGAYTPSVRPAGYQPDQPDTVLRRTTFPR